MQRGDKEFSDKQVTIFLIVAILISLVSTWTVLVTLHEVTSTKETNTQQSNTQKSTAGGALVSLTVLEKEEFLNGTK